MAVSPIGNLTYINQASSATSSLHASNMPQIVPLNTSIFEKQMQRVEESRPAEHSDKVTPDKEGGGNQEFNEQENKRAKKAFEDKREVTEATMLMKPELRILDIKV